MGKPEQASQVSKLRLQLQDSEHTAAQYKGEIQQLAQDLALARALQQDALLAADQERAARDVENKQLQLALANTARMQALGDAALEETGTVSEQVFALQVQAIMLYFCHLPTLPYTRLHHNIELQLSYKEITSICKARQTRDGCVTPRNYGIDPRLVRATRV